MLIEVGTKFLMETEFSNSKLKQNVRNSKQALETESTN